MADMHEISPMELGRHLSQIRESAGIKQAELAKRVTWSPAVLSRIESGERSLAAEELEMILAEIGTEDAERLRAAIRRQWVVLPRPSLDHADQDVLWAAEEVAQMIEERRRDPEIRNAFARRLASLSAEIRQNAELLAKREYQVAFIGSIGIGKSTAICRLTGLEIPDVDGGPASPVLEDGAGGITLCEVHLRSGPTWGILVDPRTDEEIRDDVADFADYLKSGDVDDEDEDRPDIDHQGISKEVERAIRNMAGLRVQRLKGPDGKRTAIDDARTLANAQSNARELVVEILARMELHRRDRRDAWYDASTGRAPLAWLKDLFAQINNGRHPEFSLPKRLEVVVPETLLGLPDLTVRIVDTKGIDRTAARADLEGHFDDAHTLAVLCSGFNDAPAQTAQFLLGRAREAGVRDLTNRAALLVLPRTGEALAVKDETGSRVESVEDGYELKGEQVEMALQPLHVDGLKVEFFNARQDAPERLRAFLIERLHSSRALLRERLNVVTENARSILKNAEHEAVQEVLRDAAQVLRTWTTQKAQIKPLEVHVKDSLLRELSDAHASTIRATVRREGEWYNLSYSHQLGHGARRVAAAALGSTVEGFTALCETLFDSENFREARDLISQAERALQGSYDELLRKVQLMGETSYREELKTDIAFWVELGSESGRGYKGRILDRNSHWFGRDKPKALEAELWSLVGREWQIALERLNALLEFEDR